MKDVVKMSGWRQWEGCEKCEIPLSEGFDVVPVFACQATFGGTVDVEDACPDSAPRPLVDDYTVT